MTPTDVAEWLKGLGLGRYEQLFAENEIDLDAARHLTADDLREIGLPLGPRKKVLHALVALDTAATAPPARPGDTAMAPQAAERRQLTVMFCDLVGSTALAAELDPEDMRDLMARYQDAVAGIVVRHYGYVANYLGDGVLVYFGWPQARENQAAQAVRAGLAIVAATSGISSPGDRKLAARVGVATGRVVIGDLDGVLARQVGVVSGETPNLAARLQAEADPGEVVIDAATRAIVADEFTLTELGSRPLKGVAGSTPLYRVDAEAQVESRFAARRARRLTPFVGRRNELGFLLERWTAAAAGEGQVVILCGEPGIGKSRLCEELLDRLAERPHVRLRYQCAPQHANSAFHPIIRQLERAAAIAQADTAEVRLDKLEATLGENVDDISDAAPAVAQMMGLPVDRYVPQPTSSARQKEFVLKALISQLVGLACAEPVLMLLEDAHWIDPTSLDIFGTIAARAETLPVFLLVTSRSESVPAWGVGGHIAKLHLTRLPSSQCDVLVRSLVGHGAGDSKLFERIVARTDGVPLFVEELARTLMDPASAPSSEEIPSTLQALLSSRLDRVSQPARTTAQTGSILGREFDLDIIRAIGEQSDEEIEAAIVELAAAELIMRSGVPHSGRIVFRHALIEEAAYESQLFATRRARHRCVAELYERRSLELAGVQPELIAHHFLRAAETGRALPHLHEAGKRAIENCAYNEAIAHLQTGLDLLGNLNEPETERRWRLSFLTALAIAIMAIRGYADREAGALFREALETCPPEAGPAVRFPILWNLWLHNQMSANLPEARRMIEAMTPMVDGEASEEERLQISHAGWTTTFSNGDLEEAQSHLRAGLSIYVAEKHHQCTFHYGGHDPGVCARSHCGMVSSLTGDLDVARRCGEEAISLAERLAHENSLTIAYAFGSLARHLVRDAAGARDLAKKAVGFAEQYGPKHFEVLAHCISAWAGEMLGDRVDAVMLLREGVERSQPIGAGIRTPFFALMLADVLNCRGEYGGAAEATAEAIRFIEKYEARAMIAEAHRLRGVAEAGLGRFADAEASFMTALELAERQGAKLLELRAAVSLVRSIERLDRSEAENLLAPRLAAVVSRVDTADLAEARALLA